MVGGRVLGAALLPILFAHFPLGLVILSPFIVNLVLVAPLVPAAVYFPVALVVTTAQALVGFHFGATHGTRALDWILGRLPFVSRELADRFLEVVRRLSIPAVFALPGPVLGTVAGVAGVRKNIFHLLVVPAQLAWISATYFVGEALLLYIEIVRDFVLGYAIELTAITAGLAAARGLWLRYRRRSTTNSSPPSTTQGT